MASRAKTVSSLAGLVGGTVLGREDPGVLDVVHDSRQVTGESLYVAIRGENVDGHAFAGAAVEAGAVAVCVDHEISVPVPQIVVADTRHVLGELAAAVHDYPSTGVDVVGVTGTNGKTTVTHHVESIARHAGLVTGLIGTIATRSAGRSVPAQLTTPEASDFQRLLDGMRDEAVELVAVEVSSHALELERVRGTRFAVAAFTNLSQDHLDFHGDMAGYAAAKERLFDEYEVGTAVINVDDPTGAAIAERYRGELLTVGAGGDFAFETPDIEGLKTEFTLRSSYGVARVEAPVIGEFNVANLVVAAVCCIAAGIDYQVAIEGMAAVDAVPGRFEVVSAGDPISVIVDYAHTPEGVATAVATGRAMSRGRVIALIGAGGDRDRAKRPAMGRAVSSADLAIITSDNPRQEDPAAIAAAVMAGVDPSANSVLEIDRKTAIDLAIESARDGDVVLVLGRGHEPKQDLGSEKIPFDDRVVAASALSRRRRSAESGSGSGSMSR